MRALTRSIAAAGIAMVVASGATGTATAMPFLPNSTVVTAATQTDAIQVRWRGHHGAGIIAGLAAGMILGGLAAAQYDYYNGYYGGPGYYYGPPPGYDYGPAYGPPGGDWVAYCFSRYRSFDPLSGTYLGYDGRRHYCR